jgi:hypothetical protein
VDKRLKQYLFYLFPPRPRSPVGSLGGKEVGVMSNEMIKIVEETVRETFERHERKRFGELILELNEKLKDTECVAIDIMTLGNDIIVATECVKAFHLIMDMRDFKIKNIDDVTKDTLKDLRETIKERIKEMLRRPPPIRVFDI